MIAEAFERAGELLSGFTDAQLNQGFWYCVGASASDFMCALKAQEVPLQHQLRLLRSFVPLFEQLMAVRCTPCLSHLDEKPAGPLNGACYMWWDVICVYGRPQDAESREIDQEVLRILARILEIPHDACRESALHGIGHWHRAYPCLEAVVDQFLENTQNLRSELIQ